jgi:hypothetical protein
MSAPRKDRLEAYLATRRSPSLNQAALKARDEKPCGPLAALCGGYRLGRGNGD